MHDDEYFEDEDQGAPSSFNMDSGHGGVEGFDGSEYGFSNDEEDEGEEEDDEQTHQEIMQQMQQQQAQRAQYLNKKSGEEVNVGAAAKRVVGKVTAQKIRDAYKDIKKVPAGRTYLKKINDRIKWDFTKLTKFFGVGIYLVEDPLLWLLNKITSPLATALQITLVINFLLLTPPIQPLLVLAMGVIAVGTAAHNVKNRKKHKEANALAAGA